MMEDLKRERLEKKYKSIVNREKPAYYGFLGIDILEVKHGYAKLKMGYDEKLTNPYGFVNAGFFSIVADAALANALLSMTDESPTRKLVTIEYKINIVRAVKESDMIAEAKVIHMGKDVALGEVEVRDTADQIVAKGLITYFVRR
jgi:uncharacterized protein (TIGR00369 family)